MIKIPNQYQKILSAKSILLAVLGGKTGKLYLINEGEMEMMEQFKLPQTEFQDKPGRFMTSGKGRDWKRTAVEVDLKIKEREEFLILVAEKIKTEIKKQKLNELIIFIPSTIKTNLIKKWPKALQAKIILIVEGNFQHQKPLVLLSEVVEGLEAKMVKMAPPVEAQKILKKRKK